mmetsp:Transcript_16077/g.40487  ORF Transcript_16077/g.40487 Transcript_16077/m.40487 type:complete len:237 (+) Transcript_16077:997-1707(+)
MPMRAQAVAVATPCWPAPVSQMIRFLPMRLARSACPMALLILWAPVWASSSRLSQIWAPPMSSVRRLAWYVGVGPPMYSLRYLATSSRKEGSFMALMYSFSSSSCASTSVSGMYLPPNSPNEYSGRASGAGIFLWTALPAEALASQGPPVSSVISALTLLHRSSRLLLSRTVLMMALPTTAPSAPFALRLSTWALCDTPKPTATGTSVCALILLRKAGRSAARLARAPVTPVTETA